MEVTHLENAADETEKEDCSKYSSLNDRVRSTAIVQAQTSMNELDRRHKAKAEIYPVKDNLNYAQYVFTQQVLWVMKQTGGLQLQHSAAVPAASCDNMTLGRPRLHC